MNKVSKIKVLLLILLMVAIGGYAQQVGGDATPLQYSTHTYSITMGYEANTPSWRIFSGSLSVDDIEGGTYTALQRNVAYTVLNDDISGGDAIFKIEFNGTMVPGDYTLAYKENTDDDCFKTEVFYFTLQNPLDVDVALDNPADDNDCPDLSGDVQAPGFTNYQTVIPYKITLINPANPVPGYSGSNWTFRFTVSANGQGGGTDATIAQATIDYEGDATIEQTLTPGVTSSVYSSSITVTNTPQPVYEVIINVTFNDVLGVSQDVSFELTEIEGAYLEIDADASNIIQHVIYGMPNVGDLTALN